MDGARKEEGETTHRQKKEEEEGEREKERKREREALVTVKVAPSAPSRGSQCAGG